MSIGLLLLILLAIWIVPKLVRGYVFVHRVRSQMRDIQDQMYGGTAGNTRQQQRRRKSGWSAPITRKRKKIDPQVGEYVKFEEIATETTVTDDKGDSTTTYKVEQQVTDIEWEDL
ncbi:MAG: DUF4834 family protein [Bacteroides sp.]|nr:DUF4834 family protein [Bacteroides sp.]